MHQTTKYQTYHDNRPLKCIIMQKKNKSIFTLGFRRGLRVDNFFAADSID